MSCTVEITWSKCCVLVMSNACTENTNKTRKWTGRRRHRFVCVRKRAWNMQLGPSTSLFIFLQMINCARRWTLPLPYEFVQEQSNDEWNNATSQANRSQPDKKASPMTIGGHQWPGERSLGYAPQRKPVIEGIAIRGKIKCPFLFSPHLIIHARLAKPCRYKKGRKNLLLCFGNSCHFDCLLAVSPDNLQATEANPIGRGAPVRRGGMFRRRGTLGRAESEKKMFLSKAPCLGRRQSLLRHVQNSADKQGSGPLLLFIEEAAVVRHHSALSISRSRACSNQHGLSPFLVHSSW